MAELRRLAVLTTGRQDYGILRSTILLLHRTPGIEAAVWAGGMHLQPRFGEPLDRLREDGVTAARKLPFVSEPPEPLRDTAEALAEVGRALEQDRPDALMLVGDRAETLAAAVAATLARIPVVHLHGGEESEGAIDNACRHALTKLSHLHLVSHDTHARRVMQMGEDPATVVVVGAPGLDNAYRDDLPGREALTGELGIPMDGVVVLVTVHPATLGDAPAAEVAAVAGAMARVPAAYVVTAPNADAGGAAIREYWRRWAEGRRNVAVVEALGERRYWGLLRFAAAVLGNSSSGIIEAPALGVPVVNVGERQRGRFRAGPVIDAPASEDAVAEALCAALAGGRHASGESGSGYPAGMAAPRVLEALRRWDVPRPPRKQFQERP